MKVVKAFLLIFGCIANFLGIMLVSEGMASHKAILAISGIVDDRAIQLLPSSASYEEKIIWGIFWLVFGYILIIVNSFLKPKLEAPAISNPFAATGQPLPPKL